MRKGVEEFQGHHTNQAYYKSGIMSPEYHQELVTIMYILIESK
jgi:hypothetical protein